MGDILTYLFDVLPLRLQKWSNESSVKFVIIKGTGDKAFCAGGDIRGRNRQLFASPVVILYCVWCPLILWDSAVFLFCKLMFKHLDFRCFGAIPHYE